MSLPVSSTTITPSSSSTASDYSTMSKSEKWKNTANVAILHIKKHTGVGIVCAVAYFDPGNWGVDLQAGSEFGYRLLFIVLLAGLFAVFLQVLASRMGCVTGADLATHCRLLLHSRPKHTLLWRWLGLYPLYLLAEVAIIATDLAELLGSAIALCLLFPKLELWHGVLITAFDVIILLAMRDPLRGTPVRAFEALIAILVLAVLVCMCIIIARIDVHWGDAFFGYVPSKYIFKNGALYTSVGIMGATVMPHSLFLGSALATQDRLAAPVSRREDDSQDLELSTKTTKRSIPARVRKFFSEVFAAPPPASYAAANTHGDRKNKPLGFVKAHIYHGTVDVMASLLGFAVVINSLILILASAVFFYGENDGQKSEGPASLFDAYDLIRDLVGQPAATLFAIALLCSGQSSSIIATVAGQAVSEGFLRWRVSAITRRLLTRLIAIIPSMVVAIAVGRRGIDTLLVASQVVLSIVLPFITAPLLWVTGRRALMESKGEDGEVVDYSNGKIVIAFGCVIWLVVVAANVYVLVDLGISGI